MENKTIPNQLVGFIIGLDRVFISFRNIYIFSLANFSHLGHKVFFPSPSTLHKITEVNKNRGPAGISLCPFSASNVSDIHSYKFKTLNFEGCFLGNVNDKSKHSKAIENHRLDR